MRIKSRANTDNVLEITDSYPHVTFTIERKIDPFTRIKEEVFLDELEAFNLAIELFMMTRRLESLNIEWYPIRSDEGGSPLVGINKVSGKVYLGDGTLDGSEIFGLLFKSDVGKWGVVWDKLHTMIVQPLPLTEWADYYINAIKAWGENDFQA